MSIGYFFFAIVLILLIIIIVISDVEKRLLYRVKKKCRKKAVILSKIGIEYKGMYKRNRIIKFHFISVGKIQGCWLQVLCFRSRIYLSATPIDILHPFQILVQPTYDHFPYYIKDCIYSLYIKERYAISSRKQNKQYLLSKLESLRCSNCDFTNKQKHFKPLMDDSLVRLMKDYIKTYVSD